MDNYLYIIYTPDSASRPPQCCEGLQPPKFTLPVGADLVRILQKLEDIKTTLIELPCSPRVRPIVATLSELLDLARDQRCIDMERLEALVCAAREEVVAM